jgi:HD-GYP domain-containing protein (c-di-GMP phosphodiesterase class II)
MTYICGQYIQGIINSRFNLKNLIHTINSVSTTIELRDPYTAGHQRRVAALAVAIGHEMGMDENRLEGLFLGSMVHDIGKIAIPKTILNEPGKLTREQWEAIRFHPAAGHKIVQSVEFPWPIGAMIRQHHERFDGSGYPDKLAGEDILLEARIIAVADVVEAIHCSRPYRPALGFEAALDEIMRGAGAKYDPKIVDLCRDLLLLKGFNILDNPIMRRDIKDLSFLKG